MSSLELLLNPLELEQPALTSGELESESSGSDEGGFASSFSPLREEDLLDGGLLDEPFLVADLEPASGSDAVLVFTAELLDVVVLVSFVVRPCSAASCLMALVPSVASNCALPTSVVFFKWA